MYGGSSGVIKRLIAVFFVVILLSGGALSIQKAPDFQVKDVNTGKEYRLSNFTGKTVLIDFMYINCPGCEKLEPALREIWPEYNRTVVFMSLDIVESDSEEALREKSFPWIAGKVPESLFIDYGGGTGIPMVVIIDKEGYVVFKGEGAMSPDELRNHLDSAISGRAERMDIEKTSIYALSLFAGIASFFSPCSFPMLPGYMAYYFGIGKKGTGYRKAIAGGGSAALGIMAVYMISGAALLYFASLVAPYIPAVGLVVGIVLIILGILLFTPLQYDSLLRPFSALKKSFRIKKEHGFALKLFGYGIAYGGAAMGCTVPVFLAVIVSAMAASLLTGIIALIIYSLSAALLMIAVTLIMALGENKAIEFLKRNTERIKTGSALLLIAVGIYLIWYHI